MVTVFLAEVAHLFDFDRQFSPESCTRMVATEARKRSAEERRREVYETHRHRVFAVSYYMTANELEAEQISTGTFITAFEKQVEPDATGVDRALLDELQQRFSLEASESAAPDPTLSLARQSTRRTDMEEALRVLPAGERLVFLLRDVEGYPNARVAELLNRSEREVQRTLFSARIRMRNALALAQQPESRSAAQSATEFAPNLDLHARQHESIGMEEPTLQG